MADYQGKNVVIIGLGLTGLSCVDFFLARGVTPRVMDTRMTPPGLDKLPEAVERHTGSLNDEWLMAADLIVASPGIALAHPSLSAAADAGIEIVGDIELFCREAQAPIVAITGSNGKSTVTTLVGEMAKAAGVNVGVGGNIGLPALMLLDDECELYVLELSSFQLETTHQLGAEVATVLNVSEDHMDRYSGLPAYHLAKHRIFRGARQVVVNRQDALTRPLMSDGLPCWTFGLGAPDFKAFGLREENGEKYLAFEFQNLMPVRELKVRGAHNQANALAALALGHAVGLPFDAMLSSLRTFTGLEHRCQWVRELDGVSYYNDSKATNVGAALAAIDGLGMDMDGKLVLIAGGDGKGADFSGLRDSVTRYCRAVVLIGRDADLIADALGDAVPQVRAASLDEAIAQCRALAQPGDAVLLSPACASFDMFKNYEERGQLFARAVGALA